ncbi:hypothetical protein F4604DRAFT_1941382 [Suillus subluteus]|nr:hypothetical protein F4604DRAFT_1941382 [Suillus subluteus]
MNHKVPIRVDGRFRLGDVVGSGSYAVVYHARNIIKDDAVAIKLEPIASHSSSVQREYTILKRLEGGVGIPRALWFGRELSYTIYPVTDPKIRISDPIQIRWTHPSSGPQIRSDPHFISCSYNSNYLSSPFGIPVHR